MNINKPKFLTFKDSWIWFCVSVLPTLAFIKAIMYHVSHNINMPTAAWIVFPVVLLAFWLITIYRYFIRWRWIKGITIWTVDGMGISYNGEDKLQLKEDIEKAVLDVYNFWYEFGDGNVTNYNNYYKALNGITIGFSDNPIWCLYGSEQAGFVSKVLVGYTNGQFIEVWWPDITNGNKEDARNKMLAEIRHELCHIFLTATYITGGLGDYQHDTMAKYNFKD